MIFVGLAAGLSNGFVTLVLSIFSEFIKQIDGIDFFGNIAYQEIDIILRDLQTTVTEKPRK